METTVIIASSQDSGDSDREVKRCEGCKISEAQIEVLVDTYGPFPLCQNCWDTFELKYPALMWLNSLTTATLCKIWNAVGHNRELVIYTECAYCRDLVPIDETDDQGLCNKPDNGRGECCSGRVHLCVECSEWICDEDEWIVEEEMCKFCVGAYDG